jgi:iron(III) transport system permease protein
MVPATRWLFFSTLLFVVSFLTLPSVITLFISSVDGGLRNYTDLFTEPDFWTMLYNTLVFSIGSAGVAFVLGVILAWIVERTNTPLKGLAYATAFVTMTVPGMVRTIGWILIAGPKEGFINQASRYFLGTASPLINIYSMGGMILVDGLFLTAAAFLLMAVPFKAMDATLEEAARMAGASNLMVIKKVTLPLLLPGLLSVLVLSLTQAFRAFEVPLLLGMPGKIELLTTRIFLDIKQSMIGTSFGKQSAYGILTAGMLGISLLAYSYFTRVSSRFYTVTGKGYKPTVLGLGKGRFVTACFVMVVTLLQFAPLTILLVASFSTRVSALGTVFTLDNYEAAFRDPNLIEGLMNSLIVGVVSALSVVIIAFLVAWIIVRTKIRFRWVLDELGSVPLSIPGVVLGLGLLQFYLWLPVPIYGTLAALALAYTTIYLPIGLRFMLPALLQIHHELEESGYMCGASLSQVMRKILLPLLLPTFSGAWIYVFLHSFRELSVSALLYTPTTQVVATVMLDLWNNGNLVKVSTFGTIVSLVSALLAFFVKGWGRYSETL